MVKTLPSHAVGVDSVRGLGTKIPYTSGYSKKINFLKRVVYHRFQEIP